jgi:hypothetical protein
MNFPSIIQIEEFENTVTNNIWTVDIFFNIILIPR